MKQKALRKTLDELDETLNMYPKNSRAYKNLINAIKTLESQLK